MVPQKETNVCILLVCYCSFLTLCIDVHCFLLIFSDLVTIAWEFGNSVKSHDSLGNHLNNLLREAENRIQELSGMDDTPQAPFSTRASFSSIIGKFTCLRHFIRSFYLFLLNQNQICHLHFLFPRTFSIFHYTNLLTIQTN